MASEIYVTKGNLGGSKYVLMFLEDGTISFTWYFGEYKLEQENPSLTKCFNGMKLEYGKPNEFGIRPFIELFDYDSGKLVDRWEKI